MRLYLFAPITALAAACAPPSPQPQPNEVDSVNGVRVDPGSVAGGDASLAEGNITPGERSGAGVVYTKSPSVLVERFAQLLEDRQFERAFELVDPAAPDIDRQAFERRFADVRTINATVGSMSRIEGAAGSLYTDVQLTLSGTRKDGSRYAVTGPVTLRRVNDVPGSTEEQRRWHIVKVELIADPNSGERPVKQ